MADAQAVIATVLIVKNSKKEILITNKMQRVHSFESFREIHSDIYDRGKDVITIEVRVSSSVERKEEATIDVDKTLTSTVYFSYSAFLRIFSVSRKGPDLGIFGARTEKGEIWGAKTQKKKHRRKVFLDIGVLQKQPKSLKIHLKEFILSKPAG